MGLLLSLARLLLVICFVWSSRVARGQTPGSSRALNSLLQDYAYRAFVKPRTGLVYDGLVPSNLSGIQVSAMRLRSGSLRTRGVKMYKEFVIPVGVILEQPYAERLVLVYHNLGNWSTIYYPLPGYIYLAPVLGLLAYNATNLSAENLPELDIRASRQPISINFSDMQSVPKGSIAKCVWFDLDGFVNFTNVVSGNVCSTFQQGHFSIVVEATVPSPGPGGMMIPPPNAAAGGSCGEKNRRRQVWIIVGSVVGGVALLVVLGLLGVWAQKLKHKKKMQKMEKAADIGEALNMTRVGSTTAPAATVTRTQPTIETEYVP